ncbi:MAG: DUF11 domain-containing protein [Clostridia bacterium]|nr:DUF11 domain-containing protein [Clostridia bacterium]
MAQITNQANLTFNYGNATGSAVSNIASATLLDPLSVEKTSVGATYRAGDRVTYVLSVLNNGSVTVTDVNLVDNLGTYTRPDGTSVTPLTYGGEAALYIDGVFSSAITGTETLNSVTFRIPSIAPGSNALVVYAVTVNEYAPLTPNATVTNTVNVTAPSATAPISDSNTITVENYAEVVILKEMSPDPVSDGDLLTYTFTVTNTGNIPATDVILTDAFNPAPSNITVTVNGQTVASTDYTYENGLLTLPTGNNYEMTVPAATVTQDPVTGVNTVVPGTLLITVTGTI